MKKITLTIIVALASAGLLAQVPVIEWKQSYGGSGHDGLAAVEHSPDGGYIVAGYTDSADGDITQAPTGMQDLWLLKTDVTGNILWQKTIGGPNSEMPNDIEATPDGGYIIAGQHSDTNSSHGYDFLIMKVDSEGTVEWQKILGGTGYDVAHSIHATPDGGYIVAGESSSEDGDAISGPGLMDFWVLKLTNDGTIAWQKKLGGTQNDGAWSMQLTADGGYIVAGVSDSNDIDVTGNHGMSDYWVVKLDSNGNKQWQKSYGGTSIDYGIVMTAATGGGYLFSGFVFSNDGDVTGNHGAGDMWVVKTNATGTIQWQKCLGGISNEVAYAVTTTEDGGYLLGGYAMSADGDLTANQGNTDCWVVKLDSNGTLMWQKSMGGSNLDYVKGLLETEDGGCIVVANSISGDGDVESNLGNEDYWIVKINMPINAADKPETTIVRAYPNPVQDIMYFSEPVKTVTFYTLEGKEVLTVHDIQSIGINHLSTGLYFAEMKNEGLTQHVTFIKQ